MVNRRLAVVGLFVAAACGSKSTLDDVKVGSGSGSGSAVAPIAIDPKDVPDGLELVLSNGTQGAPAIDRTKLAPATPLSDAEAQQLLARATPIAAAATDAVDFAFREASTPPPKPGTTITGTFPPPPSALLPPEVKATELTVARITPTGDVPLAPQLTVTFSQPMIAVTSQDAAAKIQPVKLAPQPPGAWRWIGTRTIVFDPEVRFPQATTYTVTIPAGTKSATGGTLAQAVTQTFRTPTPTVVRVFPTESSSPQRLDTPIFVELDQKIDQQSILAALRLTANGTPIAVQLLTDAEIAKHLELAAQVAATKVERDGRWLAFRATPALPAAAKITVSLAKGAPSAEGPDKTTDDVAITAFSTYTALELTGFGCGSYCSPDDGFYFSFNNQLDADGFDPAWVTVTPPIDDMDVYASGTAVLVDGTKRPNTKYTVTVGPQLRDEFQQTLGSAKERSFDVKEARPAMFGPSGTIILEPTAAPSVSYFTSNYTSLKVKMYAVTTAHLAAFDRFLDTRYDPEQKRAPAPGTKVVDQAITIAAGGDVLNETKIDLAPALEAGLGHAVLVVEPEPWDEKKDGRAPELIAWVQATKLGITLTADASETDVLVTELGTGKPLAGVDVGGAATDARGLAKLGPRDHGYLVARSGTDSAFLRGGYGRYRERPGLLWYVVDDREMYKPGETVTLKGLVRKNVYTKGGGLEQVGALGGVSFTAYDDLDVKLAQGRAPISARGSFEVTFKLPKTPNLGGVHISFTTTFEGEQVDHYHEVQVQEFRTPEFEVTAHAAEGPFLVGGGGDVTVDAKYYAGGPLAGAKTRWTVSAHPATFSPPNHDDYTFGEYTPWWTAQRYGARTEPRARRAQQWSHEAVTDGAGSHVLHLDFKSVKPQRPMSVSLAASVQDVNRQSWRAQTTMLVHPAAAYVGVKAAAKPYVELGKPFALDVIGVDLEGKPLPGAKIAVTSSRLETKREKGQLETIEVDAQTCDPANCTFASAKGGTYKVLATITDAAGRTNTTTFTYWVMGADTTVSTSRHHELTIVPDRKDYTPGTTAELLVTSPVSPAEGIVTWQRNGIVKLERVTFDGPTKVIAVPIDESHMPNLTIEVELAGMATGLDAKGNADPALPKRSVYANGTITLPISTKSRGLAITVAPAATKVAPGGKTSLAIGVKDAKGAAVPDAEIAVFVVDEAILALANHEFPDPLAEMYPHRGRDATTTRVHLSIHEPSDWKPNRRRNGYGDHWVPAEFKSGYDDFNYRSRGMGPGGGGTGWGTIGTGRYGTIGHGSGTGAGYGVGGGRGRPMSAPQLEAAPKVAKPDAVEKTKATGGVPTTPAPDPNTGGGGADPIAVRANFDPLALFVGAALSAADGTTTLEVTLPDNVTRYRIVAIASTATQFGKGESTLTARLPMMVRPSAPRFLNFGDKFQLPVVVQNQTDAPLTVKLAVRASNLTLEGATENRVARTTTVPPNERLEVQIPAAAARPGIARFQVIATATVDGKEVGDAAEIELPVWTPATSEAFATYGVIDDGAPGAGASPRSTPRQESIAQPVALPGAIVPQFGGLEVSTASTNLQALTDALLYIVHYRYDCAEQRSSRIMSIAALRDVLTAFNTRDMPSPAAMANSVARDLIALGKMQLPSGGFGWWDGAAPDDYPYLSVYVTNALVRARAKGYPVPAQMLADALAYLEDIDDHLDSTTYQGAARYSIQAFALYTRRLAGKVDVATAKEIIEAAGGIDKLEIETAGWILAAIAKQPAAATERAALVKHAKNKVSETAGAANFTTSYGDGAHLLLASDERTDAVMLDALIAEEPASDLIPKIVTGLLAARKAGRWLSTQENAMVLLALDRYFQTYEKTTPNFIARVWLGADYAGEQAFRGRTTKDFKIPIPMTQVAAHDKANLVIAKEGPGRLYYRIGMTYAPASLAVDAVDRGFIVERTYEGVDDPKHVTRDAQGTWHVKAGARVRVKLSMVNENRRYQVALVDPLPAGFEAINTALAVSDDAPKSADLANHPNQRGYRWWRSEWYDHQNMRDERVEAFTLELDEGVHPYAYVARATTPGNYVVPPPKAEEMYMPETFGRGASDRVIVE